MPGIHSYHSGLLFIVPHYPVYFYFPAICVHNMAEDFHHRYYCRRTLSSLVCTRSTNFPLPFHCFLPLSRSSTTEPPSLHLIILRWSSFRALVSPLLFPSPSEFNCYSTALNLLLLPLTPLFIATMVLLLYSFCSGRMPSFSRRGRGRKFH